MMKRRPIVPSLVLSYFALLFLLCGNEREGFLAILALAPANNEKEEQSCSIIAHDDHEQHIRRLDPALQEMEYDVGDGPQTTLVYVEPDINTFYKLEDEGVENSDNPRVHRTKQTPKFTGFHGKFINLSKEPMTLFWEDRLGGNRHNMRTHAPFTATGTATFPGHLFFFTPAHNTSHIVHRFTVGQYPESLYVYDPYTVENDAVATAKNLEAAGLTDTEREKYAKWMKTLRFNEFYLNKTGRSYLANYLRGPPVHFIWPADYFNQTHWVTTRETHFVQHPPTELAHQRIQARGRQRVLPNDNARLLAEYRDATSSNNVLNMTLRVISCVPRVFEILNFLSPVEVEHILELAAEETLEASKTGDTSKEAVNDTKTKTRTSKNSWLSREHSPIIDAIYRRAADLQRMDESLMRIRQDDEPASDLVGGSLEPVTELLQLVHYNVGEQYTPHHDFGYHKFGDENDNQLARFATLLLYLNSDVQGGATSFPRWASATTNRELRVEPQAGKAVLFYSQLPDGNLDDFSLHAAMPVTQGEKWLINLWTWAPTYD